MWISKQILLSKLLCSFCQHQNCEISNVVSFDNNLIPLIKNAILCCMHTRVIILYKVYYSLIDVCLYLLGPSWFWSYGSSYMPMLRSLRNFDPFPGLPGQLLDSPDFPNFPGNYLSWIFILSCRKIVSHNML
jgi:hypothetical protein